MMLFYWHHHKPGPLMCSGVVCSHVWQEEALGKPRTHWRNYVSRLARERFGVFTGTTGETFERGKGVAPLLLSQNSCAKTRTLRYTVVKPHIIWSRCKRNIRTSAEEHSRCLFLCLFLCPNRDHFLVLCCRHGWSSCGNFTLHMNRIW